MERGFSETPGEVSTKSVFIFLEYKWVSAEYSACGKTSVISQGFLCQQLSSTFKAGLMLLVLVVQMLWKENAGIGEALLALAEMVHAIQC